MDLEKLKDQIQTELDVEITEMTYTNNPDLLLIRKGRIDAFRRIINYIEEITGDNINEREL